MPPCYFYSWAVSRCSFNRPPATGAAEAYTVFPKSLRKGDNESIVLGLCGRWEFYEQENCCGQGSFGCWQGSMNLWVLTELSFSTWQNSPERKKTGKKDWGISVLMSRGLEGDRYRYRFLNRRRRPEQQRHHLSWIERKGMDGLMKQESEWWRGSLFQGTISVSRRTGAGPWSEAASPATALIDTAGRDLERGSVWLAGVHRRV